MVPEYIVARFSIVAIHFFVGICFSIYLGVYVTQFAVYVGLSSGWFTTNVWMISVHPDSIGPEKQTLSVSQDEIQKNLEAGCCFRCL